MRWHQAGPLRGYFQSVESETRPGPEFFRREERVEDFRNDLIWDPRAIVGDDDVKGTGVNCAAVVMPTPS